MRCATTLLLAIGCCGAYTDLATRPTARAFAEEALARAVSRPETYPVGVQECRAAPVDPSKQRVRRAFQSLSRLERDRVYAAMWVMHDTPTWEGRNKYGEGYLDYSDLVMVHSVAATMPDGDSAHAGLGFMPWHRAYELLFENVLLLIDPEIGALPYWDQTNELNEPMFSPEEWGSVPGSGPGGVMTDGRFANWTIPVYDAERYAVIVNLTKDSPKAPLWNEKMGNSRASCMELPSPFVTRLPDTYNGTSSLANSNFWNCTTQGASMAEWLSCISMEAVPDTLERWTCCMRPDGTIANTTLPSGGRIISCDSSCGELLDRPHPIGHLWVAGMDLEQYLYMTNELMAGRVTSTTDCTFTQGDANDPQSSPNDPFFHFFHAQVDRNLYHWAVNHVEAGYTLNYDTSTTMGYPNKAYGMHLNDVMSYIWPFYTKDLFPEGLEDGPEGAWTVADILCYTQPHAAPYTYDSIVSSSNRSMYPSASTNNHATRASSRPADYVASMRSDARGALQPNSV